MNWYCRLVILLYLFSAEIRRIIEWKSGFGTAQILTASPLIATLPIVWILAFKKPSRPMPLWLSISGWLWFTAFNYGLLLSFINNHVASGIYDYLTFTLPFVFAQSIYQNAVSFESAKKQFLSLIFMCATVISAYAIVQWNVLPEWDAAWLKYWNSKGIYNFGLSSPMQFRAWGTMNAPQGLGAFLAVVATFGLNRLKLNDPKFLAQFIIWLTAFGLTLDRSGWLAFLIGLVIYFSLLGRIDKILVFFASVLIIVGLPLVFLSDVPAVELVNGRISSLFDLDHDISYSQRQDLYSSTAPDILSDRVGKGLGLIGSASELNDDHQNFDSGLLAKYYEIGPFGFTCFFLSLLVSFGATIYLMRTRNIECQAVDKDFFAAVAGIQASLALSELSGDSHSIFLGMLMWGGVVILALPKMPKISTAAA